jgi:phage terminase large subunit-like protein
VSYEFKEELAERAIRFFRTQLRYVEGRRAGQPFLLEEWQERILRDLFGWVREDGTRRYRIAYIEVPRKNGKSTFAAGIALYLLLCDGEERPQVYSCAGDRGQASIVFSVAREMVNAGSARLQGMAELRQYKILNTKRGGWYEATSSEGYTAHGRSPHGIIFDELHTQPNRVLWDTMLSGRGAREQPLVVAITTAGHDRSSICWEMHQRAKAAIANPEADPTFYGVIYGADAGEDWMDEEVWRKANPNLGVSVSLDFLREECQAAKDNPAHENVFRNLYLNQWTEQAVRWIPMHLWDACRQDFDESDMEGQLCYAGLDLASTRDANALALLFPQSDGSYRVLPYFWIPEKSKSDRTHQDRRQLLNWAAKGLVETTPGNVTGYYQLANSLAELRKRFDIQCCAFDPWSPAQAFVQIATNECGFDVDWFREWRQTIGNFAAPSKEFERLVAGGKLNHNGNPVLRWMVENVAAKRDSNDNIKPDKEASADKIDGIVATIMALGLAIVEPEPYTFEPGSLAL